jgi:SET domain-containing protein
MLLVETYLEKSSIHGFGLFASKSIPKGTKVWEFTPGLDREWSIEEFNLLPEKAKNYILHYGWLDPILNKYRFPFDHDRFINWSKNPNVSGTSDEIFAIVDIQKDEELTFPFEEDALSMKYR